MCLWNHLGSINRVLISASWGLMHVCVCFGRVLPLLWKNKSGNLPPTVWRRLVPNMQGRATNNTVFVDYCSPRSVNLSQTDEPAQPWEYKVTIVIYSFELAMVSEGWDEWKFIWGSSVYMPEQITSKYIITHSAQCLIGFKPVLLEKKRCHTDNYVIKKHVWGNPVFSIFCCIQ